MKKLCSWILTLAMVVGMLATSAFAYLEYVSEMDYMVPSNSYVKTDTVTGRNGEQHTVYIFPAGTTFTPRTMGSFALVIYAWTRVRPAITMLTMSQWVRMPPLLCPSPV